jgi:4-hydroxy-tetrahydrodipicolinate synthase
MRISTRIYTLGGPGAGVVKGLKCALSILGVCDDCPAEPFQRFDPAERARIEQELRDLGLLSGRGTAPLT